MQQATDDNSYQPAAWLGSPHLQTLWGPLIRPRYHLDYQLEELQLPDGDFLELIFSAKSNGPVVLMIGGLGGSIESHYANGFFYHLVKQGFNVACMHSRGSGFKPNRHIFTCHMGETRDLDFVVNTLKSRYPDTPLFVMGVSLGGNVVLKWLGERGSMSQADGAIVLSVPFDPKVCAQTLNLGFAKVYQASILRALKHQVLRKSHHKEFPFALEAIHNIKSILEWDNIVTTSLYGFQNVDEYYVKQSARSYLKLIETPTLILHAKDDPFMTPDVVPAQEELSNSIQLEVTEKGGHVGFVAGHSPLAPEYWLENRVSQYIKSFF